MLIDNAILSEAKSTHKLGEAFKPAERVTGINELYLQYKSKEPKAAEMPALLFYMLLCEEYGLPVYRTTEYEHGYKITIINKYNT